MTDQGVKSEKRLYRTRVFARSPDSTATSTGGEREEGGRGGERKAGYYFPSLCQKRTRKTQKHPVPRHLLGPTAQATRGQRRRPRTPAPSDGRGEASTVSLPGLVLGLLMSHAAGGSGALASVPAQSCIGTEWAHICELPSLSVQVTMLNSLEKHRELFLVLLSTVHIICLLTGPCLFFLVAFQAGDHFNKLRHNRI